ncbi:MAG: hypothetical protein MMC33_000594 [Icmadophila ericetorum]|nr:hypothetical protein [Icmadophila ericetorum]
MKLTHALVPLLGLSAYASPHALVKRAAAPINAGAIALIEGLEGFRPNFYTINGDQTIGFGHDCTQLKDCASIHPPITKAQGTTLLMSDLKTYESCVCALPNAANLNANQYGALVSFTYNSGCSGTKKYFGADMQSSNFAGICTSLPTTNTLNGELSKRRAKEGAFCGQATTAKSGCGGSTPTKPTPSHSPSPKPKARRDSQDF